ncbi:hypothetical protein [Flavihumibacter sp. CACIAM 22H1]|uniref:hypothetical protein n=1 Tax=Flavihumibacter sp. CACIAM 22H1 TaxID=1812911 RepID=UPI0007A8023D|nr:hypothetical protein [Flavihumibacter sp. CACIAM 22H1]KYP14174.1 MAG: hypothetical protein A1D16_14405 [Flavihumibacter sp. CACIAM 22H1]
MTPDKNIVSELKELAPVLVGLQETMPYQPPVGYFAEFPDKMLQRVRLEQTTGEINKPAPVSPGDEISSLSPLLAGLSKKMPFRVPEGYFEISAGSVLATADRIMPYQVPADYFEQFPVQVLQKIRQEPRSSEARVISIKKTWLKYAVAAAVAGILAIAGWMYQQPAAEQPGISPAFVKQLNAEMQQISDEAILEFSNPTSSIYFGTAGITADDLSPSDIHDLLSDVSDDALQHYLQEFNGKSTSTLN